MFSLRKIFNEFLENIAKRRQTNEAYESAKLAIESLAILSVPNEEINTEVLDIYLDENFTIQQKNSLLKKAIGTDNTEIFNTVLSHTVKNDPNYVLVTSFNTGPEGNYYYTESSLLYTAVSSEKENIALSLSQNPDTDIRSSGHDTYNSKRKKHESCLDLARKNGMTEVVQVLAGREAELLQSEVNALNQEARLTI